MASITGVPSGLLRGKEEEGKGASTVRKAAQWTKGKETRRRVKAVFLSHVDGLPSVCWRKVLPSWRERERHLLPPRYFKPICHPSYDLGGLSRRQRCAVSTTGLTSSLAHTLAEVRARTPCVCVCGVIRLFSVNSSDWQIKRE